MRRILRHSLILFAACLAPGAADYLGPRYAAPRDLSSKQSLVAAAWQNITSTLNAVLQPAKGNQTCSAGAINATEAQNVTFSVGLFSLHDPASNTLQFHYTSSGIATAANGTRKVDGDSIYRVASVTKVFTVLAGLLELSSSDWDRPLNQVLPSLGISNDSSVRSTPWDQITMRSLGAQIGGVPRDGFPNPGEIVLQVFQAGISLEVVRAVSGLPPPDPNDPLQSPPCLALLLEGKDCPPVAYAQGVSNRPPAFFPWTTPGYTNNGFALLGLAISNATGKNIEDIYRERIFSPLRLESTSSVAPPLSEWPRSVIVGDPAVGFAFPNGVFVSSGGLYSSLHDLMRFGVGILNSTILPSHATRRWLKPVSHTARLSYSVGAPWEISRYTHASGVVTDIYTKSGDSGSYSAYFVLLLDYDMGFALIAASESSRRMVVASAIADLVADKLLPALVAQSTLEATQFYAGHYAATELNSSLTLAVNTSAVAPPGLVVTSWISNGTDVLAWLPNILGKGPFRLVPSIAEKETGTKGEVAFRLVTATDAPSPDKPGLLFSSPGIVSADWVAVDASTYFGIGLTLFVFEVEPSGKATVVSPEAWRTKLSRSA